MSDREKETPPEISVEPGQETGPDLRELTKDEIQSVSGGLESRASYSGLPEPSRRI